jgi:hypothetical protein
MEAICSSETPVDAQRTTRRYIPEDSTLHNHRCENLKSYKMNTYLWSTIFLVGDKKCDCVASLLGCEDDCFMRCDAV